MSINENSVLEVQKLVVAAGSAALIDTKLFAKPSLLVPQGYAVEDMEKFLEAPIRMEEDKQFNSVQSFIDYMNDFKSDFTKIFGKISFDVDSKEYSLVTAILDYHSKDKPSWANNKASLLLTKTPEFIIWERSENKRMSQREFLHFVQDNADTIAKPALADLTTAISKVKVNASGDRSNELKGHGEENSSNSKVSFSDGIPEKITLAISPYVLSEKYELDARIYIHAQEHGVDFSYHLINREKTLIHEIEKYREEIEDKTGLKVYL